MYQATDSSLIKGKRVAADRRHIDNRLNMSECTSALLKAGAIEVVWCFGRVD